MLLSKKRKVIRSQLRIARERRCRHTAWDAAASVLRGAGPVPSQHWVVTPLNQPYTGLFRLPLRTWPCQSPTCRPRRRALEGERHPAWFARRLWPGPIAVREASLHRATNYNLVRGMMQLT
jgi:hypothetical protein